jgi:iron(III) transport system substrate-binding protein
MVNWRGFVGEHIELAHLFRRVAVVTIFLLTALFSIRAGAAETMSEIKEAARKEGMLVWYSAMRGEHTAKLADLFMKTYPGVQVKTVELTSGDITARLITEYRGRQYNADIASASAFAVSQLNSERLLQPFILPEEISGQLTKGTYDPKGYWVSQYALTYPISYNPRKLAELGLKIPSSLEDFTHPEWRGKFAISTDYYDWYQGLAQHLGQDQARDLVKRIAANGPLVRSTSGAMLQLLDVGEYAATPHVFGYNTFESKKAGKSVDLVNATPVVVALQTGGILRNAPHPNAAKLYQIWMTSPETQQFISTVLGRTSTHPDIENVPEVWDPKKAEYVILDPDEQIKQSREFLKEYRTIFGIRG